MSEHARLTILVPDLADEHERVSPLCLIAPDGETTCGQPASQRAELQPMPGYEAGPVTFVCPEHEPLLLLLADHVTATREVHR